MESVHLKPQRRQDSSGVHSSVEGEELRRSFGDWLVADNKRGECGSRREEAEEGCGRRSCDVNSEEGVPASE